MGKAARLLILGVVVALGYVWLVPGFSVLIGGPDKASIAQVARDALSGPPDASDPMQVATIRPKGLCRKQDEAFACAVEITSGGGTETKVTVLKKGADGAWVLAE